MKPPLPDWAYLLNESGRYWHHAEMPMGDPVLRERGSRAPAKGMNAIPMRDLVSQPLWVQSQDPAIISEVVMAEMEKVIGKLPTPPAVSVQWRQVAAVEGRTLVHAVCAPWPLEEGSMMKGTDFVRFAPQFAWYPVPEQGVVLWREASQWCVGFAHRHAWLQLISLSEDSSPESIGTEVRITLWELIAHDFLTTLPSITVWGDRDETLAAGLAVGSGLSVQFSERPEPQCSGEVAAWDFVPQEAAMMRLARKKRRRRVLFASVALVLAACLAGLAMLQLHQLRRSNDLLSARIERHRDEALAIEQTMQRWEALAPAIHADRSPIELFHRVAQLLPEKGFRLSSFEIQDHKLILIRGEAVSMAAALQFKGALEEAGDLSDYEWEIPPPQVRDQLTFFSATGSYRFDYQ